MSTCAKYLGAFFLCVVLKLTASYQPVNHQAILDSVKHVITAAGDSDPEMPGSLFLTTRFASKPTATMTPSRRPDDEFHHVEIEHIEYAKSTPSIAPSPLADEQDNESSRISPTKTPRPMRTGLIADDETTAETAEPSLEPWRLFGIRATPTVSADTELIVPEESRTPVSGADLPFTIPVPEIAEAPATPTAKPNSAAKKRSEESKKGACFPGSAEVELFSGTKKRMDNVTVGDMVHVGDGLFSRVFMFTHKIAGVESPFAKLVMNTGHTIELTPGHYLYLNGRLAMAKSARVGDKAVIGNGTTATITSISRISMTGLYNPQTLHGDIVVNGVLSSTYTEAVAPGVAHALLSPLRMLFGFLNLTFGSLETGGHFLANLLPSGAEFLHQVRR